jgi:hypothetical protein
VAMPDDPVELRLKAEACRKLAIARVLNALLTCPHQRLARLGEDPISI